MDLSLATFEINGQFNEFNRSIEFENAEIARAQNSIENPSYRWLIVKNISRREIETRTHYDQKKSFKFPIFYRKQPKK